MLFEEYGNSVVCTDILKIDIMGIITAISSVGKA
jgi:hypothetical protein